MAREKISREKMIKEIVNDPNLGVYDEMAGEVWAFIKRSLKSMSDKKLKKIYLYVSKKEGTERGFGKGWHGESKRHSDVRRAASEGPVRLPVFCGYSVDQRLREFRKSEPGKRMETIKFDSRVGTFFYKLWEDSLKVSQIILSKVKKRKSEGADIAELNSLEYIASLVFNGWCAGSFRDEIKLQISCHRAEGNEAAVSELEKVQKVVEKAGLDVRLLALRRRKWRDVP